jgi:hypothetical protein
VVKTKVMPNTVLKPVEKLLRDVFLKGDLDTSQRWVKQGNCETLYSRQLLQMCCYQINRATTKSDTHIWILNAL